VVWSQLTGCWPSTHGPTTRSCDQRQPSRLPGGAGAVCGSHRDCFVW
jgi:hypothetical protein